MGLLRAIKEILIGQNDQDQIIKIVACLIAESGGLEGFVDRFELAGYRSYIDSWLSPGANLVISSKELEAIIGYNHLESLAARFGMSRTQLLKKLAKHLPKMIDGLTPEGHISSIKRYKYTIEQWRHLFH